LFAAVTVLAQSANPPSLSYATYVGTAPVSAVSGLAVDRSGYSYVSGLDSGCGFLTKLNQAGSAIVWSVCLPMAQVNAVKLDAAGYIYVAGSNAIRPFSNNFVQVSTIMKLSPDAKQTVYSTSMIGTYAAKLDLDRTGNVYVMGWADKTFVPTPGAYLISGGYSFAAKLNSLGTVDYATYLDFSYGARGDIAVDSKGQGWVVGASCPAFVTSACDISQYGTASAIRKLDAKGANLLFKKTFGGGPTSIRFNPYLDSALGLAVDSTDSVWVVGSAESDQVPTTPGAIQAQRPPGPFGPAYSLGYALKLSSSGDLLYGTYVGATARSEIPCVTLDANGLPYFPLESGFNTAAQQSSTIMALTANGSSVALSTSLPSLVQAIALDGKGGLYVAGSTSRLVFLTTQGAYQPFYPGGSLTGYAAKFDLTTPSASQLFSVVNAASLVQGYNLFAPEGAVAPGEIVTLFGRAFPPNPNVTFGGHGAPILYANSNQINAVVPFDVSSPSTVVAVQGADGQYTLPVWPVVPALFVANGTGYGPLAALNENGTVNSSSNPAKAGSVVSLYMTGLGAMTPPIGDGQLGPLQAPFPMPVLAVGASVGQQVAQVLFAGQAPGLIAGAVQINVRIPPGTPSGNAILFVYVGNYQSQVGPTTIAVQ
jgi:uncharacterized protein (TIGR03437 family)